ncbi:hypothetical protein GCM10027047_12030 [Rhodococcus aerolatus]
MTHHRTTSAPTTTRTPVRVALAAVAAGAALLLSACGGTSSSTAPAAAGSSAGGSAAAGAPVVPVPSNPISNTATAKTLGIDKLQVENNTDAAGAAVDDHLQFDVRNTGTTPLSGFEVFYTFADSASGAKESYYFKLPDTFTVPAGATTTVNFDNTGAPGHFAVNKFSLFYTSKAALDVTVEVSATGAAPVTATVTKGPGGSENAGG